MKFTLPKIKPRPEPEPGPTQSEIMQAEVARIKRLLGLDINRLAIGSDIEGDIPTGPFGAINFTTTGASTISFVNVVTSIVAGTQTGFTDVIPPGQVTGLGAIATNSTTINLSWNANIESDLNHYNVYRGTSAGFSVTLGVTTPVGTPSTNSFTDTGRTGSTTYYYKVSAVDNSGNIGPLSTEANATTFPVGSITPSLELHLESDFIDTSPNNLTVLLYDVNTNGFAAGQFGNGWQCNYPFTPTNKDALVVLNTSPIQMDTTVGFSISVWIYPVDITAGAPNRRFIINKFEDASNKWSLEIDPSGVIYFFVTKAGVDYKREITGITTGSWYHIGATFNGATNTAALYKNAVAGAASTATPQYPSSTSIDLWIGVRYFDKNATYFEGVLDELRYYKSVVLTPTQVTNLKNTNAP